VSQADQFSTHTALILDPDLAADADALERLRSDPGIEMLDPLAAQQRALAALVGDASGAPDDGTRWVYYPWRRTAVKILGPQSFRRLRLDRNRNLVTVDEQDRLGRLRIGVIGLSSGHVIAHTLAAEGVCGELRLADFDELELSNLNRVPASLLDLGLNKATAAARRIAELDPYLPVVPWPAGVTPETVEAFLDGLDVVVEQCDSLDVKALVRQAARARRLPVLMATSDRGMVDVERFDREPERPLFHGLLGDVDVTELATLNDQQKVAQVLRLIDVAGLTDRAAASLLEVGHSLATWPQLAGDVTIGAGAVVEAVRRIGLDVPLRSGRTSLDAGAALDGLVEPIGADAPEPHEDQDEATADGLLATVVAAANRAPSGGNSQPWTIAAHGNTVAITVDADLTSTMDVAFRGSAVAVGAAAFNARVAAAAHGAVVERLHYETAGDARPLRATLELSDGSAPELARWYPAVLHRETNRHQGVPGDLDEQTRRDLAAAADREGAELHLVTDRTQMTTIAEILGTADRIRYLTPVLHAEMTSELRWPGDRPVETGIDVRSLELGAGTMLALDVLKRPDVMTVLRSWGAGRVLGADTWARVSASSALGVVTVDGDALADYARGGSAVEAVWLAAQHAGLSVQPISPAFLYARSDADLHELAPAHAAELGDLQQRFGGLVGLSDRVAVLILRLARTPPASVKSRRRAINTTDRRYSEHDVRREPPSSQP
jgi:molybdopterin/thiamine biosynthesis adenylyltransferase